MTVLEVIKLKNMELDFLIKIITDDFTGIEGLPLLQLSQILSTLGIEGFLS